MSIFGSDSTTSQKTLSTDRRVVQGDDSLNLLRSAYVGGQTVNPRNNIVTPIVIGVVILGLLFAGVWLLRGWKGN